MLHITPEIVENAYELLKLTPPFRGWKLPPADDVVFSAVPIKGARGGCQGEHWFDGKSHHIRINPKRHSALSSMLATLAHEMIHMREAQLALRNDVFHGRMFQEMADRVCKAHTFDRGQF
jgi:hypothetical protein